MPPRRRSVDAMGGSSDFENMGWTRRRTNGTWDQGRGRDINRVLDDIERIQVLEHRNQLMEHENHLLEHHMGILEGIENFLQFRRQQHFLLNLMLILLLIFTVFNVGFLAVISFQVLKQCRYDYTMASRSCPVEIFQTF